jgi:transcriptional regulator with XRE-family HTH domain
MFLKVRHIGSEGLEREGSDMPGVTGPIVPRRRLAEQLKRLRAEDGRSLEDVAQALLISTSKLSRLENAQGSPQPRDVRDLIREYGVEPALADRMMRWVSAARRQGWWSDYSFSTEGFVTDLDVHVAYESEASLTRVYTIPFFPALLQMEPYARALYRSLEPWRGQEEVEQLVRLRAERRKLLDGRDGRQPLHLISVCHETALRQVVGDPDILRLQLEAVDQSLDRPNVEFRVLPFSASPPFTSTCMYTYFEFSDALDRDVVHIETHAGYRLLETDESLAQYRRYFDELLRRSLSPAASRELIRATAADLTR